MKTLATIPKLKAQWKIIYDFKPTEYINNQFTSSLGVLVGGRVGLDIVFSCSQISLRRWRLDGEDLLLLESRQLPTIGEWTRIEVSHEEEDGKFFLSFAVGGRELGRKEATDLELREMTDVRINIGGYWVQPGFIRRLLVLQKE